MKQQLKDVDEFLNSIPTPKPVLTKKKVEEEQSIHEGEQLIN